MKTQNHLRLRPMQQNRLFERDCAHNVVPISISIKTGEVKYVCKKCKVIQPNPKPLRVRGKYASKLQKAEHESKKWKDQSAMLLSMIQGQYKTIRRLSDENLKLKAI